MISISLCMIVKNEEDTLGRCLSSVRRLVDEIVIVDTGSTDGTKTIAAAYTDRIFDFEWIQNFAAARNFAFSKATMDYIFWLDADDVLKEEDQRKFAELKAVLDSSVDSVTMKYNLAFDEFGNVISSLRRNRLVKRANGFKWIGPVHEYLEVGGRIYSSDIAVTHSSVRHDSDRNLKIYEQRVLQGEIFSPRDLYYYANELKDHGKYEKAALYYEKFLHTKQGWIEDSIAACGKLADCYRGLGHPDKEISAVLRTLSFAAPRPETCCRLGFHFLSKNELHAAAFWYETAARADVDPNSLAMSNLACSTWLPHLQLCVCYDRLGQQQLAYEHNEKARAYRPGDPRILQNKQYLESVLGLSEEEKEEQDPCIDSGKN